MKRFIEVTIVLLVIVVAGYLRFQHLYELGGDHKIYKRAVQEFDAGDNPYEYTVRSFSGDNYKGERGFSYLPAFLYIYTPLNDAVYNWDWNEALTWKVPVLLADLGVAIFICIKLKKFGILPAAFGMAVWLINPYLVVRQNYTYFDPFAILFMLLALDRLGKDSFWTGIFFALSVGFKDFSILLFPVFLFLTKEKVRFLGAGALVALGLSIPFLRNLEDFTTFIQGSFLVHGQREMQGRPFLFYISYRYKLEIFQIIPVWVYTSLAAFSGWLVTIYLMLKKKLTDKYFLSLLIFALFYAFTPVLNRTYFLWGLPVFIIAVVRFFKANPRYYYSVLLAFYVFYAWYLSLWKEGFDVEIPSAWFK